MGEKEFARAADCMAKALEQEPDNASYLYNHATSLAVTGRLEEAGQLLKECVILSCLLKLPENPLSLYS